MADETPQQTAPSVSASAASSSDEHAPQHGHESIISTEICHAQLSLALLTRSDIRRRAADGQALIIIDNSVYDVSKWAAKHPGGEEVLQEYYGSDASMEFDAVGHSKQARSMLAKLKIGVLAAEDVIRI